MDNVIVLLTFIIAAVFVAFPLASIGASFIGNLALTVFPAWAATTIKWVSFVVALLCITDACCGTVVVKAR